MVLVKLMQTIFLIWGFYCLAGLFIAKCNLSETFYQVWALHMEDIIIVRLAVVSEIAVPNIRALK